MTRPAIGTPNWGDDLNEDLDGIEAKALDALAGVDGLADQITALPATFVSREEYEAGAGARTPVPLFVFIGESNSGGLARNDELGSPALAPRSSVLIWDNVNNDGFDVLDIGTNNLLGHDEITGVTDPDVGGLRQNTRHGWENALATSAEAGEWAAQVYLLKAGQGGSQLNEWENADTYWTTFVARFTAAVAALRADGLEPQVYVFASIGINDSSVSLAPSSFKTQLVSWVNRIRAVVTAATKVPNVPVAFTQLTPSQPDYNVKLAEVAAADDLFFLIDTTGAALYGDATHWTAAGMLYIGQAMCDVMRTRIGQGALYPVTLASRVSGPLSLLARIEALEAALGGGGGDPETPETVPVDWVSLSSGVTDDGAGAIINGSGAGNVGGIGSASLDAHNFAVIAELPDASTTSAAVLMVESTADINYAFTGTSWLGAIYQFGSDLYRATSSADSTEAAGPITFPALMRLRSSGANDIVADYSQDDGATWATAHTYAGATSGVTEVWPKVVFAAAGGALTVEAG